jgi:membrane protein DedA with SNARE-associated domain
MFEALWRSFGPFLIPAAVFVAGVVGYGVLYLLSRWYRNRAA